MLRIDTGAARPVRMSQGPETFAIKSPPAEKLRLPSELTRVVQEIVARRHRVSRPTEEPRQKLEAIASGRSRHR